MIKLNIVLLLFLMAPLLAQGQTVTSFEGIEASQLAAPELDIDPNGAVGTKQFMEWTNVYYQAFDKNTFAPVWSTPQVGTQPWRNKKMSNCYSIAGDGVILFDRLASRWVIAGHTSPGINGNYYYCVAVSSTDDLSSSSVELVYLQLFSEPGARKQLGRACLLSGLAQAGDVEGWILRELRSGGCGQPLSGDCCGGLCAGPDEHAEGVDPESHAVFQRS